MNYADPLMDNAWAICNELGYIIKEMNIPLTVVIDFIRIDERNYNKVEEDIQIEAIKAYSGCLEHMAKPTKKVAEAAIRHNPVNIGRIQKPTKELQILAVSLRPQVIEYIMKPCAEVRSLAAIMA